MNLPAMQDLDPVQRPRNGIQGEANDNMCDATRVRKAALAGEPITDDAIKSLHVSCRAIDTANRVRRATQAIRMQNAAVRSLSAQL
jgi:hypothetical protein